MFGKILIFLAALTAPAFAALLELSFSGRDLPREDTCCSPIDYLPDAYAIIHYAASEFASYSKVGQTAAINNQNNPSWPEVFKFNNQSMSSNAKIKVEVYDLDDDADDYMGFVEFKVTDIMGSFGLSVEKILSPTYDGYVRVTGNETPTSSSSLADTEINPQVTIKEIES